MDIASKKLPLMIIGILLLVLAVQYYAGESAGSRMIDLETCELWIRDKLTGEPIYLDEYDEKCQSMKSIQPAP